MPLPKDPPHSTGVAGGRSLIRRERMRSRVTVKVEGYAEMLEYVEKLGDKVLRAMIRRITIATVIAQREVINNVRRRFVQRTGGLRKSFQIRLITRRAGGPGQLAGGTVIGIMGSDHPGANLLDQGGVVRAKRAAAMPVPITEAARNRKRAGYGTLTLVPSGFLIDILIGEHITRNWVFVLAKTVSVQGTNYFGEAMQKAEPKIEATVGEGIKIAIQSGGK